MRDQAIAKKRDEEEARKRREDREKQRKVEVSIKCQSSFSVIRRDPDKFTYFDLKEERRAAKKAAAELEREEKEKAAAKRRDDERRRRAQTAEEKEKKIAAELESKEREKAASKRREEEEKRRVEEELKRRSEKEAVKKRKERDLQAMRAKSREVQEKVELTGILCSSTTLFLHHDISRLLPPLDIYFLSKLRVEGELQQSGGDNGDEAKLDNDIIKKKRPCNPEDDEGTRNRNVEADYRFNVSVSIFLY